MERTRIKTRTLTGVALFTAIVAVLQLVGAFIRFGPFSISLVLVPIVSLLTRGSKPADVEEKFACYNQTKTVDITDSLGK